MTTSIGRICLILASSNLRENELKAFARWIGQTGADHFTDAIESIRTTAEFSQETISSRGVISSGVFDLKIKTSVQEEVVGKVSQLLLGEARLSKSAAANALFDLLAKEPSKGGTIPDPVKMGFDTWIRRVLESTSESTLLRLATRIRNDRVHGHRTEPDWALKKDIK